MTRWLRVDRGRLIRDEILPRLLTDRRLPSTATPYGPSAACAAALAVQTVMRRDDLLANVRGRDAVVHRRLNERFGNHPFVGDVRGRGLFQGIEIVADRGSKEPFPPQLKLHARIKSEAMARGLMVYPMAARSTAERRAPLAAGATFIIESARHRHDRRSFGEAVDAAIASLPPS